MEPLIEKIDRTIWAGQWRQARARIDQTTLQRNLDSIRRITFPEPRLYKWSFSSHEGHEKFIELCKQNPNQRRDNLAPEEFERMHTVVDKSSD